MQNRLDATLREALEVYTGLYVLRLAARGTIP